MNRIVLILLGLLLMGGMAACGVEPPVPVETSPPEVLVLQVTPAVAHWLPDVAACAEGIPEFGILTQVLPRAELSLAESDLILRLGERLESDPFVAVVGLEEIVIVAGEDVPVSTLSLESLQAIYTGRITDWGDIPETPDDQTGALQAIKPLSYPEGHEIEVLFRRAYLDDEPITPNAQAFLTMDFLENLIEKHPDALAYLLASQVPEGVRVLPVTGENIIPKAQFVLAITPDEPDGKLKQLLLCLQDSR